MTPSSQRRLLACLCVIVTANAFASPPGHPPPPLGAPTEGFLSPLILQRLYVSPHDSPLDDTATIERKVLVDRQDIYSSLRPLDHPESDRAWRQALDGLSRGGHPLSTQQAEAAYLWDLGFSRALPGYDVARIAHIFSNRDDMPVLSIVKAGVQQDIALQGYRLAGVTDPLLVAPLAVAVQLLREQSAYSMNRDPYPANWYAPLDRFMHARTLDGIGEEHLTYLMRLLENETSSWRERPVSSYHLRQVPTVVRVARLAAAYESLTYTTHPCEADGSVDRSIAASTLDDAAHPFCFPAMTDRRVVEWYFTRLFIRMSGNDNEVLSGGKQRLRDAIDRMQPAWTGMFEAYAQHGALDTHVVAAGIARELLAHGLISTSNMSTLDEYATDGLCHGVMP